METFITHPAENGPFAPVIVYMDMWGVREELYDIARRIATVGYYCMLPDLYYRNGKIRNAFRNDAGRMLSFGKLDEASKRAVLAPMEALTDAMVVADTACLLDFIDRGEPVRPGAVAVTGYCMGGRHVLRVMGAFPQRVRAGACLHGVNIVTGGPDSPHLSATRGQGELYCGFAEKDKFSPPEVVKSFGEAMSRSQVRYRYEVHKGAEHGYGLPDRDVFDKRATDRDWELIFAMLNRQMPPYSNPARA